MAATIAFAGIDSALLLQAQELVHVGTWTWDVATDTVLWSDELFRLFGLQPRSIPLDLETYLSLVHPGDRARVAATIEKAVDTRTPFQFDCRMIRPDGTEWHEYSRGTVICDAAGNLTGMIGTGIDITDRVLEQEALR